VVGVQGSPIHSHTACKHDLAREGGPRRRLRGRPSCAGSCLPGAGPPLRHRRATPSQDGAFAGDCTRIASCTIRAQGQQSVESLQRTSQQRRTRCHWRVMPRPIAHRRCLALRPRGSLSASPRVRLVHPAARPPCPTTPLYTSVASAAPGAHGRRAGAREVFFETAPPRSKKIFLIGCAVRFSAQRRQVNQLVSLRRAARHVDGTGGPTARAPRFRPHIERRGRPRACLGDGPIRAPHLGPNAFVSAQR